MRSVEALNLDKIPLFLKNWRKTKKIEKTE